MGLLVLLVLFMLNEARDINFNNQLWIPVSCYDFEAHMKKAVQMNTIKYISYSEYEGLKLNVSMK